MWWAMRSARRFGSWLAPRGLLLDPVYTGRAFAGLLDKIARGELTRRDTVLFWHTGGTPALYAHAKTLLGR